MRRQEVGIAGSMVDEDIEAAHPAHCDHRRLVEYDGLIVGSLRDRSVRDAPYTFEVMKMNNVRLIAPILALGLLSLGSNARGQVNEDSYTVAVHVSADQVKGEVVSYLSRELRVIGDVVVTDIQPSLDLTVIVMETQSVGGTSTGYAMSVLITRPLYPKPLVRAIATMSKQSLATKDQQVLECLLSDYQTILNHWVQTGGRRALKSMCDSVVASLDGEVLEKMRQFTQRQKNGVTK
jgi:hypothetical protein